MLLQTVREFQEEMGWTDATALDLLCRFIEDQNLESDLADFLSDQEDLEEGMSDEDSEDEDSFAPKW